MTEILHSPDENALAGIPKRRNDHEHAEQVALFEWLAWKTNQDPLFGLAFAVPNGGNRDAVTAARLKDEGVKPGIPDVIWPVPKLDELGTQIGGLWLELKPTGYKREKAPIHQIAAHRFLVFGHQIELCVGIDEARDAFECYDRLAFPSWLKVEQMRRAAADYLAAVDAMRAKRRGDIR